MNRLLDSVDSDPRTLFSMKDSDGYSLASAKFLVKYGFESWTSGLQSTWMCPTLLSIWNEQGKTPYKWPKHWKRRVASCQDVPRFVLIGITGWSSYGEVAFRTERVSALPCQTYLLHYRRICASYLRDLTLGFASWRFLLKVVSVVDKFLHALFSSDDCSFWHILVQHPLELGTFFSHRFHLGLRCQQLLTGLFEVRRLFQIGLAHSTWPLTTWIPKGGNSICSWPRNRSSLWFTVSSMFSIIILWAWSLMRIECLPRHHL